MLWLAALPLSARAVYTAEIAVGVAKTDITPSHPVLLAGYGGRDGESKGVLSPIWARAIALGAERPTIMVAVDNCGVPAPVVQRITERLVAAHGCTAAAIAICSTHTHNAPTLVGYAPLVWDGHTTSEQDKRVSAYTDWLTDKIVEVAQAALTARQPARLSWVQGRATFGTNRRLIENGKWTNFGAQLDGPVDHSLPLLVARRPDGQPLAIWVNYACHCTTLGSVNQIAGDWAGYVNESLENMFPGCVGLTTIGCGADVGPRPSGSVEHARNHAAEITREVERLIGADLLTPLPHAPTAEMQIVELPLESPPTRDFWQQQAQQGSYHAQHARRMMEQLEREGKLATHVPCPLSVWKFGDELAMVFFAGEVVVDYAVRLKTELDWSRLWINAWTNDVPCYIPSRRILQEGGYEADFSMIYYGWPARFAPAVEECLLDATKSMIGERFTRRSDLPDADFLRRAGAAK